MRRITQVDQTTGEELGGFVAVIRPKQKVIIPEALYYEPSRANYHCQ